MGDLLTPQCWAMPSPFSATWLRNMRREELLVLRLQYPEDRNVQKALQNYVSVNPLRLWHG